MIHLAEGLESALAYIEANLEGEVSVEEAARRAWVSPFYFQRIFHALCGVSVGEYVRLRRLTLAAHALSAGDARVIDVALRYGYDSPDSFARAFARFHGILPSAAKERGAKLNAFSPIHIRLVLEGGSMLEYRILEKAAFSVVGLARTFSSDTSYEQIPRWWEEVMSRRERSDWSSEDSAKRSAGAEHRAVADEHGAKERARPVCGQFGVCLDGSGDEFTYMIADNYVPWKEVPPTCQVHSFPAGAWAVFPCTMATLQDVNTRMWKEWLPNCREYRLRGSYNLEMYAPPEQDYVELWLPVERVETEG